MKVWLSPLGARSTSGAPHADARRRDVNREMLERVRFSFRSLERADLSLLSSWLRRPHVARWWREPSDLRSIEERYGPAIDRLDPTEVFVVELDGHPIGLVQRYESTSDVEWREMLAKAGSFERTVGIDYLIGDQERLGQGLGPELIAQFAADTWDRYPSAQAIAAAIDQENRRSWRAVEKCGFRRVWSGMFLSDDPSDDNPSYLYLLDRDARRS
jgi:aminoglycoside 6'-N-acetyltransferase